MCQRCVLRCHLFYDVYSEFWCSKRQRPAGLDGDMSDEDEEDGDVPEVC